MKISKFLNRFYVIEADEGKVITTVLDPPEGQERFYSKKVYIGKWGKVENYKEINEDEMIIEPEDPGHGEDSDEYEGEK